MTIQKFSDKAMRQAQRLVHNRGADNAFRILLADVNAQIAAETPGMTVQQLAERIERGFNSAGSYGPSPLREMAIHAARIALGLNPSLLPDAQKRHSDDIAVDEFAAAMKAKLLVARTKGRGGWQDCDRNDLWKMLRAHIQKGDVRDIANFCMFIWHIDGKGENPAVLSDLAPQSATVAERDDRNSPASQEVKALHQSAPDATEALRHAIFPALGRPIGPQIARAAMRGLDEAGYTVARQDTPDATEEGWAYHNPDTGWEWTINHPVESGECEDAENIAHMTLAEFRHEHPMENKAKPDATMQRVARFIERRLKDCDTFSEQAYRDGCTATVEWRYYTSHTQALNASQGDLK